MTTNYKPLTPIELLEIYNDAHADRLEALIAIEQAAIENYLAQKGQVGVPNGWKLVPIEPTPEMIDAGHAEYERSLIGNRKDVAAAFVRRWKAMLAAAPTPPAPEDAQVGKDAERWRFIEPYLGVTFHVESHTYDSEVFLSISVPGRKPYANPVEAIDAAIAAAKKQL